MPDDRHGHAANLTADDLRGAGEVNGQSLRETAHHILEAAEKLERESASLGAGGTSSATQGGLAEPAGRRGADEGGRGTPASES
jgi:hypothetical protein